MKNDAIRKMLQDDIDMYRAKAKGYETLHLFEAAKYAERLAANIELALTTLPTDSDPEIA